MKFITKQDKETRAKKISYMKEWRVNKRLLELEQDSLNVQIDQQIEDSYHNHMPYRR